MLATDATSYPRQTLRIRVTLLRCLRRFASLCNRLHGGKPSKRIVAANHLAEPKARRGSRWGWGPSARRKKTTMPSRLRHTSSLVAFAPVIMIAIVAATLDAQQPPPGGRGRGATITSPRNAYPDRPPGDPAAIERGKALYTVNCQFCHGADTRGGDSGPSLLRSGLVLDDRNGELMAPVIQNGRTDRGMPKVAFRNDQVADLAAFIHAFRAAGHDG